MFLSLANSERAMRYMFIVGSFFLGNNSIMIYLCMGRYNLYQAVKHAPYTLLTLIGSLQGDSLDLSSSIMKMAVNGCFHKQDLMFS